MKNKILFIVVFLIIGNFSCSDEPFLKLKDSPNKQEIMLYLDALKNNITEDEQVKIENAAKALNFKNVYQEKISANEELLIVEAENISGFKTNGVTKVLFFLNDGAIVRSNIVWFSNGAANHQSIIRSICNNTFNGGSYSGKVSIHSILQDILFYSLMENGVLKESGSLNTQTKGLENGKTTGCTDWYLVTTTYYNSGAKSTTAQYLYTTCEGDCQDTRIFGRINCGTTGGVTNGGATPYFPTSAKTGEMFIHLKPNGERVDYVYVGNGWVKVLITTPEVVCQGNPSPYPYLKTDGPVHGQIKTGEGFIFEYNGYTGAWKGVPEFTVDGNDPFAKAIANIRNYIKCFNKNNYATVSVLVTQPLNRSNLCEFLATNVGHTFLSINQGEYSRTVGFYPSNKTYPSHPSEPSELRDNSGKAWDVSVTFNVSADELAKLLNYIENETPGTYHLNDFNCTNWVVAAFAKMNINLPQNEVWFPGGAGLCPGQFGEDMRELNIPGRSYTVSPTWQTGNAPTNKGDCN